MVTMLCIFYMNEITDLTLWNSDIMSNPVCKCGVFRLFCDLREIKLLLHVKRLYNNQRFFVSVFVLACGYQKYFADRQRVFLLVANLEQESSVWGKSLC